MSGGRRRSLQDLGAAAATSSSRSRHSFFRKSGEAAWRNRESWPALREQLSSLPPEHDAEEAVRAVLGKIAARSLPCTQLEASECGRLVATLCTYCPTRSQDLCTQLAALVARLFEQGQKMTFRPLELEVTVLLLTSRLELLGNSNDASLGGILRALAQVATDHGAQLHGAEILHRIVPLLFLHVDSSVLEARHAAIDALVGFSLSSGRDASEAALSNWECLRKEQHEALALALVENLCSARLSDAARYVHVQASCATGLRMMATCCAQTLGVMSPHVPRIVLALNHIVQPPSTSSNEKGKLDDGWRTRVEGVALLRALALTSPKLMQSHWTLFLPMAATRRPLPDTPPPPPSTAPALVLPAGLLNLCESDASEKVRAGAAAAVSSLVGGAPLRVWLASSSHQGSSAGGEHSNVRKIMDQLHMRLNACLHSEKSQQVLALLCECVCVVTGLMPYTQGGEGGGHGGAEAEQQQKLMGQDRLLGELMRTLAALVFAEDSTWPTRNLATQTLVNVLHPPGVPHAPPCLLVINAFCAGGTFDHHTTPFLDSVLQALEEESPLRPMRAGLLLLLAKVAKTYPWHLLSRKSTFACLSETLFRLFGDEDQNIRLHSLKLLEEVLLCRSKLVTGQHFLSEAYVSALCTRHLSRALQDPFHGVRAVACSCHCALSVQDWTGLKAEDRSQCVERVFAGVADTHPGVVALAVKVVGTLAGLASAGEAGHTIFGAPAFQSRAVDALLGLLHATTNQSIRSQAFLAVSNMAAALFALAAGDGAAAVPAASPRAGALDQNRLQELLAVTVAAIGDADRISAGAIRAAGLLACLVSGCPRLQDEAICSLLGGAFGGQPPAVEDELAALHLPRTQSAKGRWNCCNALSVLLQHPSVQARLAEASWRHLATKVLCAAVTYDESFKVRIHAAAALRSNKSPQAHGKGILLLLRTAILGFPVFASRSTDDASQRKFASKLEQELRKLAWHTLTLVLLLVPTEEEQQSLWDHSDIWGQAAWLWTDTSSAACEGAELDMHEYKLSVASVLAELLDACHSSSDEAQSTQGWERRAPVKTVLLLRIRSVMLTQPYVPQSEVRALQTEVERALRYCLWGMEQGVVFDYSGSSSRVQEEI